MYAILAPLSVSISALKVNPTAVLDRAKGMPVAVLNHNKPVAYMISPEAWAQICEALDNVELHPVARQRLGEGKPLAGGGLGDVPARGLPSRALEPSA